MAKRYRLTPELQQQIVSSIRSGGYGHVAAEAWGIPRRVFQGWLKRGRRKKAVEPYASFAAEVSKALAQARLAAEMTAFKKDAQGWLEHGPGREKIGNPGWTATVKPGLSRSAEPTANLFLQEEFLRFSRVLLEELAPYPELRTRIAANLRRQKIPFESPTRNRPHSPKRAEPPLGDPAAGV